MMMRDISNEDYITVLEAEVATLRVNYYKSEQEGTGSFATAINVLEHRITELKGFIND